MEFPTIVYKNGGPHQRLGGTYSFKPAKDESEYSSLLEDGWFPSIPEAVAGKVNEDENAPPTRDEMEVKATELGLKFDGRTSDKKLLAMINEKLAA